MTRIGVTGAAGRMGEAVVETAADREDVHVVFAVDATDEESVAGKPVHEPVDFPALLSTHEPDAVVDFTVPAAAVEFAEACADAGVPLVTGTTGHDDEEFAALEAASEETALLKATNFARGIQALRRTVSAAVEALPGYDIEVTETHHNGKRDAPSGTANTILDEIREADQREASEGASSAEQSSADHSSGQSPREDGETARREQYGREGIQPREDDEIGVHVRRAGDVRGEHEVMLAGNDEVVTLSHRAEDRAVFAAGALDAAVWLAGREAGWYDFADVIDG